jgi:hypothetical protein
VARRTMPRHGILEGRRVNLAALLEIAPDRPIMGHGKANL